MFAQMLSHSGFPMLGSYQSKATGVDKHGRCPITDTSLPIALGIRNDLVKRRHVGRVLLGALSTKG